MNTPLFSILVAQYNNGRYFEDCYNSIISQTYANWEAIIVDDASTDDSVELMKGLIGDDARFKIFINENNKGCGFTKRKCAKLASGEISGFLDPDDAITATAVEEMVTQHIQFQDVGLIYSDFTYCDQNLDPVKIHLQVEVQNGLGDFFNLGGKISAFATFKNVFYKRTDGIDAYLKRAVDQDLYLKLYEVGKIFYLNRNFYKYRQHENGISTNKNARKAHFWHWMVIMFAARRRNIIIEDLFLSSFANPARQNALEDEIAQYNRSVLFKVFRKIGLYKLF